MQVVHRRSLQGQLLGAPARTLCAMLDGGAAHLRHVQLDKELRRVRQPLTRTWTRFASSRSPSTLAGAALRLADRLQAAAAHALTAAGLPVTLSAGVADLSVASTVDELVADAALIAG